MRSLTFFLYRKSYTLHKKRLSGYNFKNKRQLKKGYTHKTDKSKYIKPRKNMVYETLCQKSK